MFKQKLNVILSLCQSIVAIDESTFQVANCLYCILKAFFEGLGAAVELSDWIRGLEGANLREPSAACD
jgi:hypothetical protein